MSWPRRLLRGLRLVVFAYLGVVVLLMLLENWLVYHPVGATNSWEPPPTPEIQDIELTCADGTCVHSWWLPCAGSKSALLYFHGNAGNLSWRGKSVVKLREQLGVSVLIVDYPGYGKSAGRPSEQGCYDCADAAYAWVKDVQGIAPRNILIYGKSLGGGVAVHLASRCEHRALVLVKTFTSAPAVGGQLFPWLPVRWIMRNRFASIDRIKDCRRPIFFAHGDVDEVIPFSLGKKLFEAAGEPKQFVTMPGVRHNDAIPDDMFGELKAFLAKHAPVE